MGHHDRAHGRVFRGLKKADRNEVPNSKRSGEYSENVHNFIHRREDSPSHNTNGDRPVMRIPEGFAAQKAKADSGSDDAETVYEVVQVTMSQTFSGQAHYYTTVDPTSTLAVQSAAETTAADEEDQTAFLRRPAAQTSATTSSSSSSAEPTTTSPSAVQKSSMSADEDDVSTTSRAIKVTSSSIATGDVTSTHGAMLADNTSSVVGGTPISATHSAIAEPEETGMTSGAKAGLAMGIIFGLALVFGLVFFCWRRKKSQRGLEEHNEKSGGFSAAPTPVNRFSSDSNTLRRTSTQTSATAPRLSLRPVTQFLPNLSSTATQNTAQNPFGDAAVVSEKGHDSANSVNSDSNQSVESSATATPGTAQFATAGAVPVPSGPNNVHRVQLEFKPSMEDELELKSGQLVRMLHEYDDGWALCTKMDRSQKGVVPRTCLSKMPVKPRGPPSQSSPSPTGSNNMVSPPPAVNNGNVMIPRPLTPTQQSRPRAPTLDGVPARKPVPGQAL